MMETSLNLLFLFSVFFDRFFLIVFFEPRLMFALAVVSDWMKDQSRYGRTEYTALHHDLKVAFAFAFVESYVQRTALDLEHGYRTQESHYIHGRLRCFHYVQNVCAIVQLRCWVKDGDQYPQLIKTERCLCQGVCPDHVTCPTRQTWFGPTQPMTIFGDETHHTLYNNQVNIHTIRREWYHLSDPDDLMVSWLRRALADVEPFAPHSFSPVNLEQSIVLVLDLLTFMVHCAHDPLSLCHSMRMDDTALEWECVWLFSEEDHLSLTWRIEYDVDVSDSESTTPTIDYGWF